MDQQSAPVIVGVGQVRRRPDLDGEFEAIEPARMMVEALDRAAIDAGDQTLAKQADYVGTVAPLAWGYADTPSVLAEMLGVGPGLRHEPKPGGNSPIELLQHAIDAIESDDAHVAVLAGAESIHARQQALKVGSRPLRLRSSFDTGSRCPSTSSRSMKMPFAPIENARSRNTRRYWVE